MPHVDLLEQSDSLSRPLLGSVGFHVGAVALLLLGNYIGHRQKVSWGSPNPGGGAVGVNTVKQIPMPGRTGPANPLANDTESLVPRQTAKKEVAKPKVKAPVPDAIPLRNRKQPKPTYDPMSEVNRLKQQYEKNQLYSKAGKALVSDMVGLKGSGGIGVGENSPFGTQYGWYIDLLIQRIQEKWRTSEVSGAQPQPAIVQFTILKDGSVPQNLVRLVQKSGNGALDSSAQRALLEVGKLPGLPPGFNKNEAVVEFRFIVRR